MIKLLALLALSSFSLNQALTDQEAWSAFYSNLGGSMWSICSENQNTPCSCSFVTCSSGLITEIDISSTIYTNSLTRNILMSSIRDFPNLSKFRISSSGNNWVRHPAQLDECFKFSERNDQNTDDSTTCGIVNDYGFCCFEKYQLDLYDNFGGSNWAFCSNLRENLCNCDPSPTGIEVLCTNGVATSFKLKEMNLQVTNVQTAATTLNSLVLAGTTFLNLMDNAGVDSGDDCGFVEECQSLAIDCRIPTTFQVCPPTSFPTQNPTIAPFPTIPPMPTKLPTLSPSKTPTGTPTGTPTKSPTKTPTIAPTSRPTFSPVGTPTISPTAEPTSSPISCETLSDVPSRQKTELCTEEHGCALLGSECFTKELVTCEDIDTLGRRQRERHCHDAFGCTLYNNKRCGNHPQSCSDVTQVHISLRKSICSLENDCLYFKKRCMEVPTNCSHVSTGAEYHDVKDDLCKVSGVCFVNGETCQKIPESCEDIQLLNATDETKLDLCDDDDCYISSEEPFECSTVPSDPTCQQITEIFNKRKERENKCELNVDCVYSRNNCIDVPDSCVGFNALQRSVRKEACNSRDFCRFQGGKCISSTDTPTISPTTAEEFSCAEVIDVGMNANQASRRCNEFKSNGCRFFLYSSSEFECRNVLDEENMVNCTILDTLPQRNHKRGECSKENHCIYDAAKENAQNGKCFEVKSCEDINHYGRNTKRRTVCQKSSLSCQFDSFLKTCSTIFVKS